MKKISNNIILFNISRKSFKDKNESNENSIIKINGSIHNSINNINIINISKNKEKHVNNLKQNLYKEKIINYNNNDKCGIMNSYNEYSENRTSRKNTNKESYNSINLTKENVKKKAKLVLFKNIKYRSPLTIKKIRLAINNHNSKKLNKINNNKNLYSSFNSLEFKNNILFPRKSIIDNKINTIINRSVSNKKNVINHYNHYNTNIYLGAYLINNFLI